MILKNLNEEWNECCFLFLSTLNALKYSGNTYKICSDQHWYPSYTYADDYMD